MNIEEVNSRIEACLKTSAEELDLSWCDIRDLNEIPALQECMHLTKLWLWDNQLSDINL